MVALVSVKGPELFPFLPFRQFPSISSLHPAPLPWALPRDAVEPAGTTSLLLLKRLPSEPGPCMGWGGEDMPAHCYPDPYPVRLSRRGKKDPLSGSIRDSTSSFDLKSKGQSYLSP